MAVLISSRASSQRRTDGLDNHLVLCGGMEDGWFLGTRNLGGGASVRTMTDAALCYRTLSNRLGGGLKTEAVAMSDGCIDDRLAHG